ncbi:unnamed protein product [Rotaria socialis]|uniref:Uncharacterized protein n=1 Tax=Rotaria socialis TaxID=392032 RepID=A0A820H3E4_9BILA|nr:unnamed protein product [Rotaria socialis]
MCVYNISTTYELLSENCALRDCVGQTLTLFKPRLVTVHQQQLTAAGALKQSPVTILNRSPSNLPVCDLIDYRSGVAYFLSRSLRQLLRANSTFWHTNAVTRFPRFQLPDYAQAHYSLTTVIIGHAVVVEKLS